jgi:hypothetical protein
MRKLDNKFLVNFLRFYVGTKYNKTLYSYFNINKSTTCHWKQKGIPQKYLKVFKEIEGDKNIYELFNEIYPK